MRFLATGYRWGTRQYKSRFARTAPKTLASNRQDTAGFPARPLLPPMFTLECLFVDGGRRKKAGTD